LVVCGWWRSCVSLAIDRSRLLGVVGTIVSFFGLWCAFLGRAPRSCGILIKGITFSASSGFL
jgi:hypothetical protein